MNLFEKFFKHSRPSEEEQLATTLGELSNGLQPFNPHWANVLSTFRNRLTGEVTSGNPIPQRYLLAREIEGLFGGMGSLNDIVLPENCQRLHAQLFVAVKDVLRVYWRKLGRETHDEKFTLLPVGASVRLVPGKIRYYERNENPVFIEHNSKSTGQIWRVVRSEGPDITNMPSYLVEHENTFMSARHECLEMIR